MTLTSEQDTYLREHRWALIATVGAGGRPQVTMMAYAWDGHEIVMSMRNTAVKWRNVVRHPEVTVTVVDDQRYLSVSGRADAISADPERTRLTHRLLESLLPSHRAVLERDIDRGLDETGRVVIRLVPERAVGRI